MWWTSNSSERLVNRTLLKNTKMWSGNLTAAAEPYAVTVRPAGECLSAVPWRERHTEFYIELAGQCSTCVTSHEFCDYEAPESCMPNPRINSMFKIIRRRGSNNKTKPRSIIRLHYKSRYVQRMLLSVWDTSQTRARFNHADKTLKQKTWMFWYLFFLPTC